MLTRRGSLNALAQTRPSFFWKRENEGELPSADTLGGVIAGVEIATLRSILKQVYTRLKRNKALKPLFPKGGFALVLDGHESSASYKQCCCGCLARKVETGKGYEIQFYHRHVMALLLCEDFTLLLDLEPQRPGEDEVTAATRLLARLFHDYPRAFDMVVADGLYAQGPFFKMIKAHGKDAMAVLKDDRRALFQDAMGVFKQENPIFFQRDGVHYVCRDAEGFTTWPQAGQEVRVVSSSETRTVRPHITGRQEAHKSEWMWVTTASKERVGTQALVTIGHKRWDIENKAFNELVNDWHADHVYKHTPTAIEVCWLLTMLAYNLFEAFIHLNLKAVVRAAHTKQHFACLITAELYGMKSGCSPPSPACQA